VVFLHLVLVVDVVWWLRQWGTIFALIVCGLLSWRVCFGCVCYVGLVGLVIGVVAVLGVPFLVFTVWDWGVV